MANLTRKFFQNAASKTHTAFDTKSELTHLKKLSEKPQHLIKELKQPSLSIPPISTFHKFAFKVATQAVPNPEAGRSKNLRRK